MGNNTHYWLSNGNSICNENDLYVLDLFIKAELWRSEGLQGLNFIPMYFGKPMNRFYDVKMASGIARWRVRMMASTL